MALTTADFFLDDDPWGPPGSSGGLNVAWLQALRANPDPEHSDVDVSVALMDLVHQDLLSFGTDGGETLTNGEMNTAIRTLQAVTARCGQPFKLPFRDYPSWKSYWVKNGAYGSWQARRVLLSELFDEATAQLEALQDQSVVSTLADAVSPHEQLGWPNIDTEIGELRRHFREAKTPQDYRAVGNDCVHVLEALSSHVYNSDFTPSGEADPPVQRTKTRLERYIENRLPGSANKEMRSLARASIEFAQQVKHSSTPTRLKAGVAADAVILLANMLRRLDEPT